MYTTVDVNYFSKIYLVANIFFPRQTHTSILSDVRHVLAAEDLSFTVLDISLSYV